MWLRNTYIILYFFYAIFGYNCVHRYINNKQIDIVSFNPKSYAFICKRICMLSLITLLYSAYFLQYPSVYVLTNSILMHTVVITGYYIKWKVDEPSTFYMHIFWIFPVINSKESIEIITANNNIEYSFNNNIYMISFLFSYYFVKDYIYTKRIENIDKPK